MTYRVICFLLNFYQIHLLPLCNSSAYKLWDVLVSASFMPEFASIQMCPPQMRWNLQSCALMICRVNSAILSGNGILMSVETVLRQKGWGELLHCSTIMQYIPDRRAISRTCISAIYSKCPLWKSIWLYIYYSSTIHSIRSAHFLSPRARQRAMNWFTLANLLLRNRTSYFLAKYSFKIVLENMCFPYLQKGLFLYISLQRITPNDQISQRGYASLNEGVLLPTDRSGCKYSKKGRVLPSSTLENSFPIEKSLTLTKMGISGQNFSLRTMAQGQSRRWLMPRASQWSINCVICHAIVLIQVGSSSMLPSITELRVWTLSVL